MAEEIVDVLNTHESHAELIQYIVITVVNEQYGIDIKYIDNIVRMQSITRVPKVQPFFKGVINLRGEVVPVMSIRKKMGLGEDEITNKSRIIILKYESNASIGIVVDEVKHVVTISSDNIERVSHDSKLDAKSFISGVGKVEEGLISILDLATVIDEEKSISES
ncbi:MAG: purine-binding chemotaxis protein CheW [Lachnospiraceae bacterium]|nr:purine-binding chemotaxis protein CheW [Lachnospiraceae bacterium]